jgi:hypothetical protein
MSLLSKPFSCNTSEPPASVANKRLTETLNPLNATLTKNAGGGEVPRRSGFWDRAVLLSRQIYYDP